jgi:hypothetical protein
MNYENRRALSPAYSSRRVNAKRCPVADFLKEQLSSISVVVR